jgi:hypothetical protein
MESTEKFITGPSKQKLSYCLFDFLYSLLETLFNKIILWRYWRFFIALSTHTQEGQKNK